MPACLEKEGQLFASEANLHESLKVISSNQAGKAGHWWDYSRFKSEKVRVLVVSLRHLLLSEIKGALDRLGHPAQVMLIPGEELDRDKVERLYIETIKQFKPDFLLTINHLGFDREGVVTHLLESLRVPIASWYVDSPYLILGHYRGNTSPMLTLFMWDRDYVPMLEGLGLERVIYLPLGVDEDIFNPGAVLTGKPAQQQIGVGFVGNSMVIKSKSKLKKSGAAGPLLERYQEVCKAFIGSPHLVVRDLMRESFPDLNRQLLAMGEARALDYETSVIWQTTGWYRKMLLEGLQRFHPTVAGDPGWSEILGKGFRILRELNYYADLPVFYRSTKVNFNATSRQMKNGLNQRVFDVPASRSLLLTDFTRQLEDMFEPGKEVLAYRSGAEIPGLVEKALKDTGYRENIARAGYKRALNEHTYARRLTKLIDVMRANYA